MFLDPKEKTNNRLGTIPIAGLPVSLQLAVSYQNVVIANILNGSFATGTPGNHIGNAAKHTKRGGSPLYFHNVHTIKLYFNFR